MPDVELPGGRHVFAMNEIRSGSGGLIRAVLLRNRLFAERAGVQPTLLVLRPYPDYPERKARLVEEGLLSETTPVLSVFDHLRSAPPGVAPDDAPLLPPVPGTTPLEETYPDGSPYRTVHLDQRPQRVAGEQGHVAAGHHHLTRHVGQPDQTAADGVTGAARLGTADARAGRCGR